MNILHIVRALDVGGLERVVLDLAHGSRAQGHDVHIVCLHKAGTWGASREDVVVAGGRHWLQQAWRCARIARRLQADVLHSHNPEPHRVAVLAGIMARIPVIHTKHGRNYPGNRRRVWLNRQMARLSRSIVCVSADAASVATDIEKVPKTKVTVIPNGIDTEDYRPSPRKERIVTIGTVGRLSLEKNYAHLIEAFRRVYREVGRSVRLLIVGDGVERPKLERLAADLPVTFAGMQPEVAVWLGQMDIFCLSSRSEGISITLLEAGAMGIPAVVTDVGGNREIVINEKSGILVTSGDTAAFAAALVRLAGNAALRERMGAAAREHVVSGYSVQQMVRAYGEEYGKVESRKSKVES